MNRMVLGWGATVLLSVSVLTAASARPNYLQIFKQHYNTASGKPALNDATCAACHIGPANQGRWNPYGEALRAALAARSVTDIAKVKAALDEAGKKRNAAAGKTFAELIAAGELPASTGAVRVAGGAPIRANWQALFNGANMDGWTKMNAGDWTVENGLLRYTGGGNGWLRTNNQYRNYALVIVWKYVEPGNANDSGIFVRAGLEGNPWPTGANQLMMGPGQNFGSISGTQGTRTRFDLIKPTDWNVYQITVQNGAAALSINGQVAWEKATGLPDRPGYIGIQAENRKLDIAGVWLTELP